MWHFGPADLGDFSALCVDPVAMRDMKVEDDGSGMKVYVCGRWI